jgi:hypothetical protein
MINPRARKLRRPRLIVNTVYHYGGMELFLKICIHARAMNTRPASASFEIVTLPIGNGWRVRIADGEHLQFVIGFDASGNAEERGRASSRTWLDRLKTLAERL